MELRAQAYCDIQGLAHYTKYQHLCVRFCTATLVRMLVATLLRNNVWQVVHILMPRLKPRLHQRNMLRGNMLRATSNRQQVTCCGQPQHVACCPQQVARPSNLLPRATCCAGKNAALECLSSVCVGLLC